MIVDKKLKGVKAVQTLSRLNRTCPGKIDTFVLDFANKKEDILKAFQPFYQETSLEQEVNVDLIYQTERELLGYGIYNSDDIEAFIKVYNQPGKQDNVAMGKMTSVLKPVADRYTGFEVSKSSIGECWIRSCCDWSGRQDDDICGLDNSRLDLYDKMKHILAETCLSSEFRRLGLEVA